MVTLIESRENLKSWGRLVDEVYRIAEEIYMQCPTCSKPSLCTEELQPLTPKEVVALNDCCACILDIVLGSMQGVEKLYIPVRHGESYVALYVLSDVLVEVAEGGAMVIPITELETYAETLRELGEEEALNVLELIKKALKS